MRINGWLLLVVGMLPACLMAQARPDAATYRKLADEADAQLRKNVLDVWFPRCVDETRGGFDAEFSRDWKKGNDRLAFIVFQSRMTWISAAVARRRPELRRQYLPYISHGLDFLRTTMSDPKQGGMFWEVSADGAPTMDGQKHAYGISFGFYAAAAAYQATHDKAALDLAMSTFRWFDQHAHDPVNGGYYETLTRDGQRVGIDRLDSPVPPMFIPNAFPAAYKSMNAHIHLLESLTELYRASKDPTVRDRLEEVLKIVRDKIVVEPGCMNMFFRPDWRPVPDYDSFGHDIETAFLMTEAADALGRPDDEKTWRVARMIVDHALAFGFDHDNGGFYDKGSALETAYDRKKTWWVQFEGLNALLIMHERYGADDPRYWEAFAKTFRFITDRMADKQFGGFYMEVEQDGTVQNHAKANQWKAAYHDGRALLNTADRLRRLADAAGPK